MSDLPDYEKMVGGIDDLFSALETKDKHIAKLTAVVDALMADDCITSVSDELATALANLDKGNDDG